jgi:transcriptional regulator
MEKLLKQLIERVDVLIKLSVLTGLKEMNQTERIMSLHRMGIPQSDIASILGTKINNVTATVSREAKKRKKT